MRARHGRDLIWCMTSTQLDILAEPEGFAELLGQIKARVRASQVRALRAVNTEIIQLYWSIGKDIRERQRAAGWGGRVIERLAAELRSEFPHMRGLSRSNLMYMRAFAEAWTEFVPQAVGQIPWGHVRVLLDRLDTATERDWYAARAVAEGWSRAVLLHQIDSNLRARIGSAPTNFRDVLPAHDSDLAQAFVRDPYVFEHVSLAAKSRERELEDALMDRVQETLLSFGKGVAFVGRQTRFDIDGDELVVDLLLFHVEQLRYIVVELKVTPYEPAFLGQLGTYVAVVDDLLRRDAHAPTVGILLCTGRNERIVGYGLSGSISPMAVSTYSTLTADERAALPSPEELEMVVAAELAEREARETREG